MIFPCWGSGPPSPRPWPTRNPLPGWSKFYEGHPWLLGPIWAFGHETAVHALRLMATFQPFVEFTSSLGTIVVIFFGGRLALQGTLPIADLVAFFLYLDMFYQPVRALSGSWEQVQQALPRFTSLQYGHPGYGQLHAACPTRIRCGAATGSERCSEKPTRGTSGCSPLRNRYVKPGRTW